MEDEKTGSGEGPSEYLYFYYRTKRAVENLRRAGKTRGEVLLSMNERFLGNLAASGSHGVDLYERYLLRRDGSYFRLESGACPIDDIGHRASGLSGYDKMGASVARAIHHDTGELIPLNVPNCGVLPELEPEDVIEVPCVLGGQGAEPIRVPPIPGSVSALVRQAKAYERLTIDAALSRDPELTVEALAANPMAADRDMARRLTEVLVLQ